MKSRQKKIRFILVGLTNTAIDFGILFALTRLNVPLILANTLSTACALLFSFVANRNYTFAAQENGDSGPVLAKFIGVTLVGLWVLQPFVLLLSVPLMNEILQEPTALFVAKVLATLVSMTWNYLLYDRFVFRARGDQ